MSLVDTGDAVYSLACMDVDGTSFRQRDRVWCPMLFRSGVGGGDDDMRVGSHGGCGGGDHGDAWWKRALSGNLHAGKQSLRGNRGSGHVLVGWGAGRGVVRSVGLVYLHSGGTFVAFTSCRGLGVGVFCSFRAQNIACPPEYFVLPVEFESDDRDGENGVFYHAAG